MPMDSQPNSLLSQRLARGYILLLFFAQVVIGVLFIRQGHIWYRVWSFGDWLINYQGGFVRRGLIGDIFFHLGKTLHINLLYVIALAGMFCYAVIFHAVWRRLAHSSWRWWVFALIVSPAILAFPVIDRYSGYRKEVMYLAGLAYLIERLNRRDRKPPSNAFLIAYLSCIGVLLVLSHEGLLAYLPYCAAALLICLKRPSQAIAILILPVVLSGIAMASTLAYLGNIQTVEKICASIGAVDIDHCSYPIKFLDTTKAEARALVVANMRDYHYLRNYTVVFILAAIPIVGAFWSLSRDPGNRRALKIVLGAAVVSGVLSFGLFKFGTDWGRWIYIHLFSLFFLLLMIDARRAREQPAPMPHPTMPRMLRVVSTILVFAYAICWSLPGNADFPLFGYVGMAEHALRRTGAIPASAQPSPPVPK
jgi:hypothetical protein